MQVYHCHCFKPFKHFLRFGCYNGLKLNERIIMNNEQPMIPKDKPNEKIILFVIGVLVGAVISTAAFVVYTKTLGVSASSESSQSSQQQGGGTPPEMPSGSSSNSQGGTPPDMPGNNSNSTQNSNSNSNS